MTSRAGTPGNRLQLTVACGDYDRTQPLRSGSVGVEGVDLNYLTLPVEETFHRMVKFGEFDVAELSLSTYVLTLSEDDPPFIAIPVFPSRSFRHSGIYVNRASGIRLPTDLKGRVVGVPEYQVTAAVWIRGILEEFYGVPVSSVSYRTGGLHAPGRVEKFKFAGDGRTEILPIQDGKTLAQMLVDGEIDALYSPRTPQPITDGDPSVGRLFPAFPAEEREYFRQTGIFPIMHVLVIRRDVYEQNRWLARSLFKAFDAARRQVLADMQESVALAYMLPWLVDAVASTREAMGDDWWPYGIEPNRPTLEAFLRYSHQQGLADRAWAVEDLFAPESLEEVII